MRVFTCFAFAMTLAVSTFQPVAAGDRGSTRQQAAAVVIPVYPYDITDRPYVVLGEVRAGVRKATIFSKAPSQDKVYRELWERAQKLGADAVVKAQYGDPHVSALSWGSVAATGIAVKFSGPAPAASATPIPAAPVPAAPATATPPASN